LKSAKAPPLAKNRMVILLLKIPIPPPAPLKVPPPALAETRIEVVS
jgi:hypothetical protein